MFRVPLTDRWTHLPTSSWAFKADKLFTDMILIADSGYMQTDRDIKTKLVGPEYMEDLGVPHKKYEATFLLS